VITEAQRRVYEFVVSSYTENGYPPTVREIGEALGYSSSATTQVHLKALVEKGYLKGAGRTLRPAEER
jgi:repressor LexA